MSTPNREKVREVFAEALELSPDQRVVFLDRACAGDEAVRAEVESLLAAIARSPRFLSAPTGDAIANESAPGEGPGSRIGAYKVLEEIGHGGFGKVYMAEQEQPVRRRVALKIIRLGMDTRAVVARFESERQALAMMDHPHIAQVFDAGATELGRPYFVMELVRGVPITAYAEQNGLSVRERLELFVQVCNALQHAHSKGIIHRDIKPGNVLVSTRDGRPHAKVIDFGIAKATGARLTDHTLFTEFQQLIGTPEYMSPEQAGGAPDVDTRSDVYSLGTLLYELLTGTTPIESKSLRAAAYEEMRRIIREVDPPTPSTRVSKSTSAVNAPIARSAPEKLAAIIAGDLDWIVMKAIDKDRSRRYQTPSELAEDLARHLAGEPVKAAPPSSAYRAMKYVRRNRVLVGAASAVIGACFLGLIGTSLGLLAASRAHAKSQASALLAAAEAKRATQSEAAALQARIGAEFDAYIASVESAYGALRLHDTPRLNARLDACVPSLRNWEWRYLNATRDFSQLTMRHPARSLANLVAASYSRDGSQLISRNGDGNAWLWDAATGAEIRSFSGPEKIQGDVQISPDGRLVLAAALDADVWVWDAASGAVVSKLHAHTGKVSFAAFVDHTRVISASEDGTARLWDARSGNELRAMRHENAILAAALSPDATRLATASADSTVRLWSLERDAEPTVLRGHAGFVVRVRWSLDGTKLTTASFDGTARVWHAHTGQQLSQFQHTGRAVSAEFSPDGTSVVSFATQGDPCVWNAATGGLRFTLAGHTNSVLNARFSDDDKWILTSSRDTTLRLWNAQTGVEWSCLRGHTGSPWTARFSPDAKHIMSTGDTTLRIWPLAQDREQSIIANPLADCAALVLCPDQSTVIDVGAGRFRLVDLRTGKESRPFDKLGSIGVCAVSPDGRFVATALPGNAIGLWDVREHRLLPQLVGHSGWIRSLNFSSDSSRIVSASEDATARTWEVLSGREIHVFKAHDGAVNDARFDTSGRRIVTAGRDRTLRVWDATSAAAILTLTGHSNSINAACFSPDSLRILSMSADFTARLWNLSSGECSFILRGHGHTLLDGGFSPDGSRIVTCSMDGTARLWDAASGRQILSLGRGTAGMIASRFTDDGSMLFLGSADGKAWLLDSVPARERK